jgi:Tripartite tricarboxylate transporter TctB family
MSRAEAIFAGAIFVVVAALIAIGYFVIQYSWITVIFPLIVGIVVCALCLIELARLRIEHQVESVADEDTPMPLSLSSLAWMFALIAFLYGLGFVFGPALYLLACLRANDFSWRLSGGIAAVSLLVTWGLFIKVMGVLLPVWPPWLA